MFRETAFESQLQRNRNGVVVFRVQAYVEIIGNRHTEVHAHTAEEGVEGSTPAHDNWVGKDMWKSKWRGTSEVDPFHAISTAHQDHQRRSVNFDIASRRLNQELGSRLR